MGKFRVIQDFGHSKLAGVTPISISPPISQLILKIEVLEHTVMIVGIGVLVATYV